VQEAVPVYDMRKRKAEDNQSEKKSKSFVIHSRNGSVKDKLSNSQISSPSRKSKDLSSVGQSVTKGEILKLHEQIALLQDKLKRVEERQEQMEKYEGTLSKIYLEPQHELKEV
jgi:flagellar motility protein MotE (MotC chaperone)